jgi:hypothetical protein
MNPLLVYGYVCRILTQGDLLALPKSLDTITVCDAFANRVRKLVTQVLRPKRPLLAAFNSMYGWKYYPLGLLKLAADLAGFAGPVLLHELVDLVEKGSTDYRHAYIYAALLCLSNFVGSVCNTQYSFRVSKVQVAVRAAVVTTVFRKSMRKRMGQPEEGKKEEGQMAQEQDGRKEPAPDETFATTGQVLNLMSTDCDRIANFCPRCACDLGACAASSMDVEDFLLTQHYFVISQLSCLLEPSVSNRGRPLLALPPGKRSDSISLCLRSPFAWLTCAPVLTLFLLASCRWALRFWPV